MCGLRRFVAGLGLSSWLLVAGCSPPSEFVCSSDEACRRDGVQGSCQATGFCSFPDGDCPSGQRYVEHASAELSDACVEAGITATAVNHHRIDVAWTGAGEGPYDLEQNGVVIRAGLTVTSFRSMGLEPSTEYVYRVRGADGRWSLPASAVTAAEPAGVYADQVLADEPRAFWRMEETDTPVLSDSTGNIAAGQLEGGDPAAPGKVGSGSGFSGDDSEYAKLGTVHTADSDWGWSWELWAYVVAVSGDGDSGLLGCNNSPRWGVNSAGLITVGLARRMDTGFVGLDTDVELPFGQWKHLALTVDRSITDAPVVSLYIDGTLAYRAEDVGAAVHSPWSRGDNGHADAGELSLNRRDSVSGVQGAFDEAAAYDYVLAPAQVARHHRSASR